MSEIDVETAHTAATWDERYAGSAAIWSGKVNLRLAEQVEHLTPGHALDIGCGEGGDAFWLAEHGWTVLAVDVSTVAVQRAASHAPADVRERITWQQADILSWQPPAAAFDLVSMQYLHLPLAKFVTVAQRLTSAVRPGGSLLVVNHDLQDHAGVRSHHPVELFMTLEQIVGALDASAWRVETQESLAREATMPDGTQAVIHDAIVRAVRR